jgi:Tfp pilus assembly protein PilF
LFKGMDLEVDGLANLRLAYFQLQRHDIDAAARSVTKAISIDPFSFGTRLFDGALKLVRGEYARAIQSFRIAAEERPNSCSVYTNMAVAYLCLKRPEKALGALRRAVALDPLNHNAIALLADVAFSANKNEDAVPSLRYFLGFEQKNSSMWARLARALLELGEFNESIAALKRQGSIEDNSAVWNNLGVAYHRKKDRKKASEAFKFSMKLELENPTRTFFLAARNLALMLGEDRSYEQLLSFTESVLADDKHSLILYDRQLSDLCIFHVHSLVSVGELDLAAKISERILADVKVADNLKAWMAASLTAHFAFEESGAAKTLELIEKY